MRARRQFRLCRRQGHESAQKTVTVLNDDGVNDAIKGDIKLATRSLSKASSASWWTAGDDPERQGQRARRRRDADMPT